MGLFYLSAGGLIGSMFGKRSNQSRDRSDKTLTVIDRGALCEGTITKGNNALINGVFKGEITCSGSLTITPSGEVSALIEAKSIYVDGLVRGTLQAERVELGIHACVIGDIHAQVLVVAEGAVFQGCCYMEHNLGNENKSYKNSEGPPIIHLRSASVST